MKCDDLKVERPYLHTEPWPRAHWEVPTWCQRTKGHDGEHEYADHNFGPELP